MKKNNIKFIRIYDKNDIMVPVRDILAMEASGHYTRIFFREREGIGNLSPRSSFQSLVKNLPENFMKISRFQIVNIDEVLFMTVDLINFTGGSSIKIKGKKTYQNIAKILCFKTVSEVGKEVMVAKRCRQNT